jgi:hypothetical protein
LSLWPGGKRQLQIWRKTAHIEIPQEFSFINDPDGALACIGRLVDCLRDERVNTLLFDHRNCEHLDLCASAVMDVIFLRGKSNASLRSRKLTAGGFFSSNDDVNVLLKSNGILKNLNHPSAEAIPPGLKERLRVFELFSGHRTPPEKTSDAERASTKLVEFFDSCLNMEGYRLKDEKVSTLVDLIAEVLGNAEEHSGQPDLAPSAAWYAIGYHKGSGVPGMGGECHIVLFNFGESIFQSLASPETSDRLKEEISRLADVHRRRGFFDLVVEVTRGLLLLRTRFWQEDALWTLYALQEGVSRFRHRPGNEDRGNGTVRMIDFFRKLASGEPRMVILSGRTWILFDGTHSLKTIIRNGEERKVIAFNDQNDLNAPPDPRYVRTLDQRFPGTLVSLKFKLRSEDLAKAAEGLREDEHH